MYFQDSCFLLLLVISNIGDYSTSLQLTPRQVYVIENSSATLTCSKSNGALLESLWTNSQVVGDANLYSYNGQCVTTRFLKDSDLFKGLCNDNGTYSVFLKRIDRSQHGAEWICTDGISTSDKSIIQVSVPATYLILSQSNGDYIKENQNSKLTCRTSSCRPNPRVQWYLRNNGMRDVYNLTQFSTYTYVDKEYGLKAVESILDFKPNRTVNGFSLYCMVWTRSDSADITSREMILNVTYPPDSFPKINVSKPDNAFQVIESDSGIFLCSVTGGNPLASLSWNCFGSNDISFETKGNIVSSTIKWTALQSYKTCTCQAYHLNNWKRLINVTVNVQYPPLKPTLTIRSTVVFDDVRIIENNTLQVICKSESNPFSNYSWTGTGISSKSGDTLKITGVKKVHQGQYTCNASNRMTRSDNSYKDGSNSSSFNLIMLYPPSVPKLRFGNLTGVLITSNIVNVVKGDTFNIFCDVVGNPAPNVTWDDKDKSPSLSFSDIVSDTKRTCTATNVMNETAKKIRITSVSSASLSINVFYPPGIPTINVSNFNGDSFQEQDEIISIIESETINVTCFSKSKPMPTYQWVREKSLQIKQDSILNLRNISRNENGTYFCKVHNFMNRSIGTTEEGKNNSKIILNIFYPAIVDDLEDKSVVEGSQVEKVCPVITGNPSTSMVGWSRQIDQKRWDNKLYIRNVSRSDDSYYTCIVITEMFPTIGSYRKIEKKHSFHLNVFFKSEITKFSLAATSKKTVVINNMDSAPLVCIAEANPSSHITIENPRGDYISEVSNSNIARHTLRNASFVNAGEYTCKGRNNYTSGLSSSLNLILIVKCPPRPSSGDTSIEKVATSLHVDVTLQFSAWNYLDEPSKTIFSWFKENKSVSDNGSKYIIRTDGLQTTLSIRNITQHDLGFYQVTVTNSVGSYIHNYNLKATDKPDPLIDFQVINDLITDESVALTWRPGFNGGLPQKFVILYKMKFGTTWLYKSLNDTGNKNMNYTLFDLKSMQEYEIEMFAKNREGDSTKTDRLTFKTKASISVPVEGSSAKNTWTFVGLALGSVLTTLVVVALSIIGYKRLKNYKSKGCKDQTQGDTLGRKESLKDGSQTYSDLDASKRDKNVYDTVQHQSISAYERLNIARHKSNEYMELKDTTALNTETSDHVNIRI